MNSSPWAKFTTSMMPKIRVRPEATSARIMPATMPLTVWTRMISQGRPESQSMRHTPRYWWITGSLTLSSPAAAWCFTVPFSMK